MSRSVKKPWVKDSSNTWMKPLHSRKRRRITNTILQKFTKEWDKDWWYSGEGHEWRFYSPIVPLFPVDDEITEQYDICDYIFYCKNDVKYTRK